MLQWLPSSRPGEEDILDVLRRSRNCSAKDERDKIFASLGLISESQSRMVCVDYSKEKLEVCVNFAVSMMRDHGRMDILVHNASQWMNTGFECSWVPLWHVKCVYKNLPDQFSSSFVDELAFAWFLPRPKTSASLRGTSPVEQTPPNDFRFRVTYWGPQISGGPAITLPCLDIRAHFLDTISEITELSPSLYADNSLPLVYHDKRRCPRCTKQDLVFDPESYSDRCKALDLELTQAGAETVRFCTVWSIGFAQLWHPREQALVGDTIWALSGLAVPMILRRTENHYFLVGECYLYRAALPHLCPVCGETWPWPMVSEIISIR